MAGKIRSNDVCPVLGCGKPFKETVLGKNRVDLVCPVHLTRPEKYYIDARHLKAKKIYTDAGGDPFVSYESARELFDEMTREKKKGGFDPSRYSPSLRKPFLVENEAREWLSTLPQDKSAAYSRNAESFFRVHVLPAFGSVDVRTINARMIEAFYRKLIEKKLAPKSIASILKSLGAFLKREHRLGVIQGVPLFPEFKAQPRKEKGWLHSAHQASILSVISARHRLPFETMMGIGIRPGEVIALRTEDILPEGYIRIVRAIDEAGNVRDPKNGKGREMRVLPDLHGKLMAQAGGDNPLRESKWLFINEAGGHYSRESLHQIWLRACRKAGVKIGMYQGCRHSRATQTYIAGQERIAAEVAGELGNTVAVAKADYILSVRKVSELKTGGG